MLRQKYVAGTHCHPICAVINLYTVHIVIQVLGKFLTNWLKDTKQIYVCIQDKGKATIIYN